MMRLLPNIDTTSRSSLPNVSKAFIVSFSATATGATILRSFWHLQRRIIYVFGLPAHTTHILQPLDVVVFQPFRYWHSRAVADATRSGCTHFNKLEFLAAITSIRAQTFKATTIKAAFKKTGLYPFDPEVVIGTMRERHTPTPEKLPIASSLPSVHTPYTPRALQSSAYNITEDQEWDEDVYTHLQMFTKGAVAQAYADKEVERQLRATEVAEKARKQSAATKRSSLQKQGVLYASQARLIVHQREIDRVAEAWSLLKREAEKERIIFLTSIRVKAARLALLRKRELLDVDLHSHCIYKIQ